METSKKNLINMRQIWKKGLNKEDFNLQIWFPKDLECDQRYKDHLAQFMEIELYRIVQMYPVIKWKPAYLVMQIKTSMKTTKISSKKLVFWILHQNWMTFLKTHPKVQLQDSKQMTEIKPYICLRNKLWVMNRCFKQIRVHLRLWSTKDLIIIQGLEGVLSLQLLSKLSEWQIWNLWNVKSASANKEWLIKAKPLRSSLRQIDLNKEFHLQFQAKVQLKIWMDKLIMLSIILNLQMDLKIYLWSKLSNSCI